ncbi:hypothetical protein E5288_WYG018492 [Bos mutus]|uniref:Uncharacterized protein n=1 Tax=Bos mutus TaxID=72004 RepID=A0A6B0RXL0_9CETA|nr:hypothetical protein [Bos mutus]
MHPEPGVGGGVPGSEAQVHGQSSPPTPMLLRKQPGVHKPPSPPETTEPLSGDVCLISSALQHHPCGEEASGEFRTEEPQGTEGEQGWRRAESSSDLRSIWKSIRAGESNLENANEDKTWVGNLSSE